MSSPFSYAVDRAKTLRSGTIRAEGLGYYIKKKKRKDTTEVSVCISSACMRGHHKDKCYSKHCFCICHVT